ncbi:IS30 family transposase [Rhodococcus sp. WS4]|nr:IS30 family transposase [Rhodococcus sp. WS4]
MVERNSRLVMLLPLPDGHTADKVAAATIAKYSELPAVLMRSATWDRVGRCPGTRRTPLPRGCKVYFCDPHSPWQRGTNESTNGLLRQYIPRGIDLSVHGPDRLHEVAALLNSRPRKTLEWDTPLKSFAHRSLRQPREPATHLSTIRTVIQPRTIS